MENKFAVSGAHGTGKTTLIGDVAALLRQCDVAVALVPEVPRRVCDVSGDPEYFRREKNSLARQMMLMVGQAVCETSSRPSTGIQLCDRTIIDHWAYTSLLFREELDREGLHPILDEFVRQHANTYRQIFLLRPEFSLEDDGVRESDVAFQSEISSTIQELLERYQARYQVVCGSREQRVQRLMAHIRGREDQ